ncbi:MAG: DUF434 domain-containing protein [Rhodothermales bacterium]|nr:DUF434 domain-containing protein [Rhodothermales bacterium]
MSPDRRKHRGPHPDDRGLFSDEVVPILREAGSHLSWLLTRGYTIRSSLKLVGDRYQLHERQRIAIRRASCSKQSRDDRTSRLLSPSETRGQALQVDGLNVIVSVEAAIAGGVLLLCQDDTIRDLASVHGSYRKVDETTLAVRLIGNELETTAPESTEWLIDRPVSNSGRLAEIIRTEATRRGASWSVELVTNPDRILKSSELVAASSDSAVLDRTARWLNLTRNVIDTYIPEAWIIDLRLPPSASN